MPTIATMIRASIVPLAGVAIAALLFQWGTNLAFCMQWPINSVLYDFFFLPAAVVVESVTIGHPTSLYLGAAAVWPAVWFLASMFRIVLRPRRWWEKGLMWVAAVAAVGVLVVAIRGELS